MGTENKVYNQMLKNEKTGSVVFGYTGSYNHGSIDTLPEWKAKDKEVTKYINSLADKKRISPVDKKRAGFYLKGGYGLTAEALTTEKASKIASEISVQVGLEAQLPFQHSEFKTAGDMFDAATQKQMAEDLSAHISTERSNIVASSGLDLEPIGGDYLNFNNDLNSEVITVPTPVIAAKTVVQAEAEIVESGWINTTADEAGDNQLFVVGTETKGVNDQYYDDDVPNLSILNEKINTDTYQSGNESLARQLESKTYGVDGDKNLITPGNETSFIDHTYH